MKLSLEKFKEKLLSQIQKQYPRSYTEKDEIIIVGNKIGIQLPCPIEYLYRENMTSKDIREISKVYMDSLANTIDKHGNLKPIDYHNIYPMIRNKEFCKEDSYGYIRKHYFLDLDIIIVEDCMSHIRYIGKHDDVNEDKAIEAAMFNINRLKNELYQPVKEFNIFGVKNETDHAVNLLLNHNFKKQIREKVGKNFLLAIPSFSWIGVAPNQKEYIPLLKEVIKRNSDPNTISSRVYRVNGNEWEYAD